MGLSRWQFTKEFKLAAIQRLETGIDFLKGCLQGIDAQRKLQASKWKAAVYEQIQTQRDGDEGLKVDRMCRLGGVVRAGFYRSPPDPPGPDPDLELRVILGVSSYFDTIDHELLIKLVQRRVRDLRVLRLIRRWMRAGVMHEGVREETLVGSPQGAVISPLLSNIYLHTLDLYGSGR